MDSDSEYTTHVFEYDYEGATWTFDIPARNRADAEARVERLALYGRWLGDNAFEVPARAGFWVPLWCRVRNAWRR